MSAKVLCACDSYILCYRFATVDLIKEHCHMLVSVSKLENNYHLFQDCQRGTVVLWTCTFVRGDCINYQVAVLLFPPSLISL